MEFRLDRTAFHLGNHREIERYHISCQAESIIDRLRAASYLNSVAFNYDLNSPPQLDRTAFTTRKHIVS